MLTREEAISRLVELDVAKWGESEREASRKTHAELSHGLALNTLAHYDPMNIDAPLAAQAKSVMTNDDRNALRRGG